MLGPQPVCDAERERAETGVSTALADAARLAPGGTASGSVSMPSILAVGIWMLRGCGWAMGAGASAVSRRLSDSEGSPKRRSREAPRAPAPGGGGGKLMALGGDGVGRCELLGGTRTIGMLAGGVSNAMLTGLWLRGGEYGGGGSGAAGAYVTLVASRRRAAGETTLGKERRERLFTLRLRSTGRGWELMTSLGANGGRGHPFLRVVGQDGALRRVALALALRIGKGGRDRNGRVRRI